MAPPNRRLQENPTLAEAGRTLADTDIVVVVTDPDGDPVDVRVPVGDLPGGGGGASDAADVTFTPAGTISSTDVQAALEELDNDVVGAQDDASTAISGLAAHLADTSDAHDASAVSFVPGSGIAATTVQEAVEEAKNDATAYADSAISTHAAATDPHGDRAYAAGLVDDLSGVTNAATARTNLGVGTAATLASDTDGTLAANSDTAVATQKATKTYADTKLSTSTAAATYQTIALAATKATTTDLIDAKGDRLIGSADNTLVRKAAPSNGKFGVADSAQSDGWKDIDLPWHLSIDPVRVPAFSTVGGTIAAWATYYQFSALNDEVVYNVQLGPGTWTFGLWRTIFTSYGILTVTLDGTTIATLDNYSAGSVNPGQVLTTGIAITAPGVYALKLKTTGKNASSSAYNQRLWAIDFTRTA